MSEGHPEDGHPGQPRRAGAGASDDTRATTGTPALPGLVLASASPRRRELLERVGLSFVVDPAEIDERRRPGEVADTYAARIAQAKARRTSARHPAAFTLAADTIVVVAGEVLGKPGSVGEAGAMLVRLAGRTHRVLTATCLLRPGGGPGPARVVETEVEVSPIPAPLLDAYLATGEWMGKAGAYAVQGIFSAFILGVRGSYTNVVGLPLAEVLGDLRSVGAPEPDLRKGAPA